MSQSPRCLDSPSAPAPPALPPGEPAPSATRQLAASPKRTLAASPKRTLASWEIRARRRNAAKSIGPRTVNGKRRSALNAVKWRACSRRRQNKLLARGEDPAEFRRLYRDVAALLRPTDSALEVAVHALANGWWRKVRLLGRAALIPSADTRQKLRLEARIRHLNGRIDATLGLYARALRQRTRKWHDRLASALESDLYSEEMTRKLIEARLRALEPFFDPTRQIGPREERAKRQRALRMQAKAQNKTNLEIISQMFSTRYDGNRDSNPENIRRAHSRLPNLAGYLQARRILAERLQVREVFLEKLLRFGEPLPR